MTKPVTAGSKPLVRIENLVKHFDLGKGQRIHAVDDVSLTIGEREIVGLVGESGSGKSTLGKTILGLHDKTAGTTYFGNTELPTSYSSKDFQTWAPRMQMIFQDPYSSLNPRMTVGEIVGEGLSLHSSFNKNQINEKVAGWLTRVGLQADHMSRYPHEFSGGQRQRIGIARALILEPEFVVCDEPISALDVSVQAQVVNLLDELKDSMGLTLLFIAHDLSMVRYVSDRMAVMYLGSLVEVGNADEVFFEPQHPYTKILVGSNPEPDPKTERARASTMIEGEIPSPVNVPTGCRFANRCPEVHNRCRQETPDLMPLVATQRGTEQQEKKQAQEGDTQRLVACHLFT